MPHESGQATAVQLVRHVVLLAWDSVQGLYPYPYPYPLWRGLPGCAARCKGTNQWSSCKHTQGAPPAHECPTGPRANCGGRCLLWAPAPRAPDSPGVAPDTPGVAPEPLKLAPDSPGLPPDTPELAPDTPGVAPDTPGLPRDTPGLAEDGATSPQAWAPGHSTCTGRYHLRCTCKMAHPKSSLSCRSPDNHSALGYHRETPPGAQTRWCWGGVAGLSLSWGGRGGRAVFKLEEKRPS